MQYVVLPLEEFSTASHFFRAVSQVPAQATAFITIGRQLAELKLTTQNLRQLVPIPEFERQYINGIAALTTYQVWFAGAQVDPICLGVFDVPLFSQGELYVTFDASNVNDSGKPLDRFSWVLVTAGGEQDGAWSEDATTAILYSSIPNTQTSHSNCKPPWDLFEQQKPDNADEMYDEDDPEYDFDLEDDEFPLIDE